MYTLRYQRKSSPSDRKLVTLSSLALTFNPIFWKMNEFSTFLDYNKINMEKLTTSLIVLVTYNHLVSNRYNNKLKFWWVISNKIDNVDPVDGARKEKTKYTIKTM